MGWSKWFGVGSGESMSEKTTKTGSGSKYESLRTNDGDKGNHQHTWVDSNESGNVTGGGATPGK